MSGVRTAAAVLDSGLDKLTGTGVPPVPEEARDSLLAFVALLLKWNRVYNLTAVRDAPTMVERHLLDSLVIGRWLPVNATATVAGANVDVMDIGTGAGLPVLPLAIVRPDLGFLSVESNGKKTRFQQQVLLELGIRNVDVVQARVDTIRQKAATVLSRAFTAPEDYLNVAKSLCVNQGRVIVMLGLADRLPRDLAPAYELEQLVEVDVPGTESARHVAVCRRLSG